jgi:hypothetical protein
MFMCIDEAVEGSDCWRRIASQFREAEMTKKSRTSVVKGTGGVKISDQKFLEPPDLTPAGVWSGRIARLRIYHSPGRVFAYKAPGTNADQVGFTDDPNLIRALFLARDNGRSILGVTSADGSIGFIDY